MLGKTNSISFPAKIDSEENALSAEGKVTIDRTKWGMTYASDESAPNGMYIKPNIDLHFKVSGKKI